MNGGKSDQKSQRRAEPPLPRRSGGGAPFEKVPTQLLSMPSEQRQRRTSDSMSHVPSDVASRIEPSPQVTCRLTIPLSENIAKVGLVGFDLLYVIRIDFD